jgi:hypothetical protein
MSDVRMPFPNLEYLFHCWMGLFFFLLYKGLTEIRPIFFARIWFLPTQPRSPCHLPGSIA